MNNAEREALKKHISSRIEGLESNLEQSEKGNGDSGGQENDESAAMDEKINSAVASRITESEKRELLQLKANLLWLDSDDAGFCDDCGEEIPHARLMAVPVTRLCIQCAQK